MVVKYVTDNLTKQHHRVLYTNTNLFTALTRDVAFLLSDQDIPMFKVNVPSLLLFVVMYLSLISAKASQYECFLLYHINTHSLTQARISMTRNWVRCQIQPTC